VTNANQDHILIVDDDRELRVLLSDYLQKNGYRVSAVADGAACGTPWRAAASIW
jgi:two-component system OmpR family response regulator